MEISIKDILRIYQSAEVTDIIDVFTKKIEAIDEDIATLTELRSIINEFKDKLIKNGITNVNALPALLDITGENKPERMSYHINALDSLEMISAKRADNRVVLRYFNMRPMRVLSSCYKGTHRTKADNFETNGDNGEKEYWAELERITKRSGNHATQYSRYSYEGFEGHNRNCSGSILTHRILDDTVNDSPFEDYILGGWFIAVAGFDHWDDIQKWLDESDYYELDDTQAGGERDWVYGAGLTGEISALIDRRGFEIWDLLMPIRVKQGAAEKYKMVEEIKPADEILEALSVNNRITINFDDDVSVYGNISSTENGNGYTATNEKFDTVISTNMNFSVPVKVDMQVMLDVKKLFIRFHQGELVFWDDETILFKDISTNHNYWIQHKHGLSSNKFTDVTWILEKDFMSIIINGSVIHYGVNYPYFNADCGFDSIKVGVPKGETFSIKSLEVTSLM